MWEVMHKISRKVGDSIDWPLVRLLCFALLSSCLTLALLHRTSKASSSRTGQCSRRMSPSSAISPTQRYRKSARDCLQPANLTLTMPLAHSFLSFLQQAALIFRRLAQQKDQQQRHLRIISRCDDAKKVGNRPGCAYTHARTHGDPTLSPASLFRAGSGLQSACPRQGCLETSPQAVPHQGPLLGQPLSARSRFVAAA